MRTLGVSNFGTSIQKLVSAFYTNTKSAALKDGFFWHKWMLCRVAVGTQIVEPEN